MNHRLGADAGKSALLAYKKGGRSGEIPVRIVADQRRGYFRSELLSHNNRAGPGPGEAMAIFGIGEKAHLIRRGSFQRVHAAEFSVLTLQDKSESGGKFRKQHCHTKEPPAQADFLAARFLFP
jgi:hypothetical protein